MTFIVEIVGGSGGVRKTGGSFGGWVVTWLPRERAVSCQVALVEQYRAPNGAAAKVDLPITSLDASQPAPAAQL